MKKIQTIADLHAEIANARAGNKKIGLVPTMGALHEGHLSLVKKASEKASFLIVTIFVNPTQFNDPQDLHKYPRTLDRDMDMLQEYPVDVLFAPSVEEMYPEKDSRVFDLNPLDSVMEGKFRPGHFNGVAQIVSKLFEAASPDIAFFGQKDFQQLAIIKKMTRQLNMDIEIVGCPIIRENDGLAMSSRNQILNKEQRAAAPIIYEQLLRAKELQSRNSPAEISKLIKETLNEHPLMDVEYFEIVDDQSLMPVKSWSEKSNKLACIAVQFIGVRLIDNIFFD